MFQHDLPPARLFHGNNNFGRLSCWNSTSNGAAGLSVCLAENGKEICGTMEDYGKGGISDGVCLSVWEHGTRIMTAHCNKICHWKCIFCVTSFRLERRLWKMSSMLPHELLDPQLNYYKRFQWWPKDVSGNLINCMKTSIEASEITK